MRQRWCIKTNMPVLLQEIYRTDRPFMVKLKQHIRDYIYANNKSNFPKHLLEKQHPLNSMENSTKMLHTTSKGRMLNTIEKFYIYKETKNNR
jgi:hypothetical protein